MKRAIIGCLFFIFFSLMAFSNDVQSISMPEIEKKFHECPSSSMKLRTLEYIELTSTHNKYTLKTLEDLGYEKQLDKDEIANFFALFHQHSLSFTNDEEVINNNHRAAFTRKVSMLACDDLYTFYYSPTWFYYHEILTNTGFLEVNQEKFDFYLPPAANEQIFTYFSEIFKNDKDKMIEHYINQRTEIYFPDLEFFE